MKDKCPRCGLMADAVEGIITDDRRYYNLQGGELYSTNGETYIIYPAITNVMPLPQSATGLTLSTIQCLGR